MFSGSDSFDFANLNQSWLVNEEKQFFEAIVEAIKNT
jgi:DNA replication initiation complex subunit (GINS family)